jgi:hypothetical protein
MREAAFLCGAAAGQTRQKIVGALDLPADVIAPRLLVSIVGR